MPSTTADPVDKKDATAPDDEMAENPPKTVRQKQRKASLEPEGLAVRSRSLGPGEESLHPAEDDDDQDRDDDDDDDDDDDNDELQLDPRFIDDIAHGMTYACLSITDDKEKTLKKVGKTNPWQVEALKIITGSTEAAHQPLSRILKDVMGLDLDCHIDKSGITPGGHFIDTQGFIAHNDHIIVLSYRCTTSVFDWLTNFNSTCSVWEPEEDLAQGFSGCCSGFEGLCCVGEYKPRVHTGFYNNFLASLSLVQQYIDPLLAPDQPPRTLYVCGHSLGGGVATLAGCYFLLHYDWTQLPHRLCNVTAGSPRACGTSMKQVMDERLEYLGNAVKVYRIVKGRDVVATVPPSILGFQHIVKPVVIKDDGQIVLKKHFVQTDTDMTTLVELAFPHPLSMGSSDGEDENDDSGNNNKGATCDKEAKHRIKYEKMISKVPRALRDHMPDFYLRPLFNAKGIESGDQLDKTVFHTAEVSEQASSDTAPKKRGFIPKFLKKRRKMPDGTRQ